MSDHLFSLVEHSTSQYWKCKADQYWYIDKNEKKKLKYAWGYYKWGGKNQPKFQIMNTIMYTISEERDQSILIIARYKVMCYDKSARDTHTGEKRAHIRTHTHTHTHTYIHIYIFIIRPVQIQEKEYGISQGVNSTREIYQYVSTLIGSVGWSWRIHRLHLCRGVTLP